MKTFITALWLACGMGVSLAETLRWQGPDDLISWLQSQQELDVSEYQDAVRAWYKIHGSLDADKDRLGIGLIDDLAFRRFAKQREARDLPGVSEFFEAEYDTSLKNRMFSALSDGKDDEFSARVVHHALCRKNWDHPKASFRNAELRRKLYNKLMGGPETLERIGSDFSLEDQQAMKHALEEKWPVLLEEPVTPRDRKPPVQEAHRDTVAGAEPRKDHLVHPGSKSDKGATLWLLGFLSLLAAVLTIIFIKRRRGIGK